MADITNYNVAQYLIVHDLLEQVQRAAYDEFDLVDINRAGGLPALCSTPRDRKTPGMRLSKETNVGATQAFWTRLARLAWRQGGFGWAHKVIKAGEGRETARRLGREQQEVFIFSRLHHSVVRRTKPP